MCSNVNEENTSKTIILKGWKKYKTIFRFKNFCRCLYPWVKVTFISLFLKCHHSLLFLVLYPPAMDSYKLLIVWMFRNVLLYALVFLLWCWEHNTKSWPISWIALISSICTFSLPHLQNEMDSLIPCWKHNLLNCDNSLK